MLLVYNVFPMLGSILVFVLAVVIIILGIIASSNLGLSDCCVDGVWTEKSGKITIETVSVALIAVWTE
jgi:hypothetical protein